MKKSPLFIAVVILTLASCERIDNEAFFKIGGGHEYKFNANSVTPFRDETLLNLKRDDTTLNLYWFTIPD
ncbi:MAG: hypothetical protein WCS03_11835 [Bacteroidota bacterium]